MCVCVCVCVCVYTCTYFFTDSFPLLIIGFYKILNIVQYTVGPCCLNRFCLHHYLHTASNSSLEHSIHFLGSQLKHWRRKWQSTPVFLPGKFQGQRSLAGYIVRGVAKSWTQLSDRAQLKQKNWFHFNTLPHTVNLSLAPTPAPHSEPQTASLLLCTFSSVCPKQTPFSTH